MYQAPRMGDVLRQYPVALDEDGITVRDAAGNSLLALRVIPDAPVLIRSSSIYESERAIACVEIAHSYRDVILGTLGIAAPALLLSVIVYSTPLVLPLRAVYAAAPVFPHNLPVRV